LKEVEESDLFIGIYALRYGIVSDGEEISITEMEYLHAKILGKPIYCFLLDEENQPWLKKWIEGEPGESRLKDFKKQIQKDIRMLITQLPDDQREVVILRHYSGLSFKEIADITDVSINTALGRMRYALINMRKMMEEKKITLTFN